MKPPEFDQDYLLSTLLTLLGIHSPTGYTDPIVRGVCQMLQDLNVEFELTRRGAIRATLKGKRGSPDRAVVTHLDTIGAMVKEVKDNGRLALVPVGTWSARFAEGGRVSIFTDDQIYRGQVLPLKASGHTYNHDIDTQPVGWGNVEVRVDEIAFNKQDLIDLGINVGDFVGFDSATEEFPNGFICARHLDNKAGASAVLAAAKYMVDNDIELPVDLHLLFTISEEVGSGASAVLHGDVAEMITVDNGTTAPGQTSEEFGVTIAMADSTGPFDYHLTHHLIHLCQSNDIQFTRDIFRYYQCDSASALEAGNDIRTALLTFGVDGSHGYERTNMDSLLSIAKLIVVYATQRPLYASQRGALSTLEDFPETRDTDVDGIRFIPPNPIQQVPEKLGDEQGAQADAHSQDAPPSNAAE
ncbi:osmoprotectant NAGGN system M42 family peptidase [Aeoliella sp. ICT_H6.2]|uniref:Osmoprotectant NAGGN system M42 family peptidase n=1 Tax=Aeoliella straminimaris TaxID=2954799 RepID=A0A9X2F844_9BACT|nr:osmoprotectant NAGGN system M42 family peptidase [Aeoliella straminimaris]MCO6043403.1 osmoprotectant NAGGN system M42 family peptidase [Aeoliella straminimaris]